VEVVAFYLHSRGGTEENSIKPQNSWDFNQIIPKF
jgi:hypothetical protein